jgi:Tol biopolymer transport system component
MSASRVLRKGAPTGFVAGVVMVVLVILASVACTSRPEERPATEPASTENASRNVFGHGWIAYRDGPEIMAVDPTHPHTAWANRIALGTANGADPIGWSRDGTRLLLEEMTVAGPQGIRSDLFVLEADGSRIQLTRNGHTSGGSFSPDATRVVYEVFDRGLYVVDADGGTPRLLASDDPRHARWLGSPAWTPDGSRIAFAVYDENRSTISIGVMNPDGTGRRKLIDLREGRGTGGLTWSPDGSRLAFHSVRGAGQFQIYVVSADGSGLRQLTQSGGASPTWSPDGSRIAFVRHELYSMASDGTDVQGVDAVWPHEAIAWNPVS